MCGVREMCGHTGHGGGWQGDAAQVPPTPQQQPKAFWGPKGSSRAVLGPQFPDCQRAAPEAARLVELSLLLPQLRQ